MKKKSMFGQTLMLGALLAPLALEAVAVSADSFYQNQTSAHAADITNWIASTPEQIKDNISSQQINPDNLDFEGERYVIQWGDTLWGISQATGISIEKLAYDNNIQNIDLIYAGDTLILKRSGDVPVGYHTTGNGHSCAQTKTVINNYYGDNNKVIINNSTFVNEDHSKNTYIYAPVQSDNSITFANNGNNNNNNSSATSSTSDSSTKDGQSSSSTEAQATSESSTSSSASSSQTQESSSSTVEVLDQDAFVDKVQDKLTKLYTEDKTITKTASSLVFFSHDTTTRQQNAQAKAELDKAPLYKEATEANQMKTDFSESEPRTEKNADILAGKIYDQIKKNNSLATIEGADKLELELNTKAGFLTFNVFLYTAKNSSSSSDSSSSSETMSSSSVSRSSQSSEVRSSATSRSTASYDSDSSDTVAGMTDDE